MKTNLQVLLAVAVLLPGISPSFAQNPVAKDIMTDNAADDASREIQAIAKEARDARLLGNCLRFSILVNRLWSFRQDSNSPFWKRHGLDGPTAPSGPVTRINAYLTRTVETLNKEGCPPRQAETASKLTVGAGFRYMDRYVGDRTGVGVAVVTSDPFFLKTSDRVDGWSAHLNFGYQDGKWRHGLGLSYSQTESKGNAVEPVGGRSIGYVPGNTALGAGVNFGAFGASATSDVTLNDFALDYKLMTDFNLDSGFNWGWLPPENGERSEKRIGVVTSVRMRALDHDGHLQRTPDPTNVYVNIDQSLKSFEFMTGPAIGGRHVYNWSGFYIGASARLQGGFIRSTLNSTEQMCFGCGGTLTYAYIDQSKTDFSYRAQLQGSIGFKPRSNIEIGLTGSVSYGTRHVIDTRQNPADTSTAIGLKTGVDWGIGARASLAFWEGN